MVLNNPVKRTKKKCPNPKVLQTEISTPAVDSSVSKKIESPINIQPDPINDAKLSTLTTTFCTVSSPQPSNDLCLPNFEYLSKIPPLPRSTSIGDSIQSSVISLSTAEPTVPATTKTLQLSKPDDRGHCLNDAAFSLFQSAGLFPSGSNCDIEEEKQANSGGGLFDDCNDSSQPEAFVLPSSDTIAVPISTSFPATNSLIPPSHLNLVCTHRSPSSVLSNHSSHPPTPVSVFASTTNLPSTQSPSSFVKIYALPQSQSHTNMLSIPPLIPSPSIRLFDHLDCENDVEPASLHSSNSQPDDRFASNASTTHHGLAAYLPRSTAGLNPTNDRESTGIESPKSCLTSPPSVPVSSRGKNGHTTARHSNAHTPVKNGSEARGGVEGKLKDPTSVRRRCTEVEKLKRWTVTDNPSHETANHQSPIETHSHNRPQQHRGRSLVPHKSLPLSQIPVKNSRAIFAASSDDESSEDRNASSPSSLAASDNASRSSSRSSRSAAAKPTTNRRRVSCSNDFDASDQLLFTEPLVERVKRRRQQRQELATVNDKNTVSKSTHQPQSSSGRRSKIEGGKKHTPTKPSPQTPLSSSLSSLSSSCSPPPRSPSNQSSSCSAASSIDRRTHTKPPNSTSKVTDKSADRHRRQRLDSDGFDRISTVEIDQNRSSEDRLHRRLSRHRVATKTPPDMTRHRKRHHRHEHQSSFGQSRRSNQSPLSGHHRQHHKPITMQSSPPQRPIKSDSSSRDNSLSPLPADYSRSSTPSTIAYTHSLAGVEEADEWPSSSPAKRRRGRSSRSPSVVNSDADRDKQRLSSPEPLANLLSLLDKEEEEEQITDPTTCLNDLTNHLTRLLCRVEEIDLVGRHSTSSPTQSTSSIPEAACLERNELLMLLYETQQARLANCVYAIPTGRLVRLLTLLLVNIRRAVNVDIPSSTWRSSSNKRSSNSRRDNSSVLLNESQLWQASDVESTNSSGDWSALVLTGLECSRIALNLVVAPDMPRPLLMEDLIESIIALVKRLLDSVICHSGGCGGQESRQSSRHQQPSIHSLAVECVGYRVALILAYLTNLVRFQPHRLTDNLVFHLTGLSLTLPTYYLTSSTASASGIDLPTLYKATRYSWSSSGTHNDLERSLLLTAAKQSRPSRQLLANWRLVGQRSSLGLVGLLFGQYEAHRKPMLDDLFANLMQLSSPVMTRGSEDDAEDGGSNPSMSTKRSARNYCLLSSHWLYVKDKTSTNTADQSDAGQPFVQVNAMTALCMALTQGLIQPPSSSSSHSSTSTDSASANNSHHHQFVQDEKSILTQYTTALRIAHYLVQGLFKRVFWKTEVEIRSLLDTVVADLLQVALQCPVEWPSALILLQALTNLLVQHLTKQQQSDDVDQKSSTSSTSSRSIAPSSNTKLVALDLLTAIAVGLQQPLANQLIAGRHQQDERQAKKTDISFPTVLAAEQLTSFGSRILHFLGSRLTVGLHWLVSPAADATGDDDNPRSLRELRLLASCGDCLLLSAHRFHLAQWLYVTWHHHQRDGNNKPASKVSSSSTRRPATPSSTDSTILRRQLLGELTLTNHAQSSEPVWLIGHRSSSLVGSSSTSTASFSALPPGSLLLANSDKQPSWIPSKPSVLFQLANRLGAHAHLAALRLIQATAINSSSPGTIHGRAALPSLELLFGLFYKLANDSSVPLRCKALRSLAQLFSSPSNELLARCRQPADSSSSPRTIELTRLIDSRQLDAAPSVREAVVDLVARLLLSSPCLLMVSSRHSRSDQIINFAYYYQLLCDRVLDKGLAVRKRVVRCFRDLLLLSCDQPCYRCLQSTQLGVEVGVRLLKRVADEQSIRQFVVDLFQQLWFDPLPDNDQSSQQLRRLDQRIMHMGGVALAFSSSSTSSASSLYASTEASIESIVGELFKSAAGPSKSSKMFASLDQTIGRIFVHVKDLLRADHGHHHNQSRHRPFLLTPPSALGDKQDSSSVGDRLLTNLPVAPSVNLLRPTLVLLGLLLRVKAPATNDHHHDNQLNLLVSLLQQSSTQAPSSSSDVADRRLVRIDVPTACALLASIEALLVPGFSGSKRNHSRLFDLQETLIRIVQRQGRLLVDSAVLCLGKLVNNVLNDFSQVEQCFGQFYNVLLNWSDRVRQSLANSVDNSVAPILASNQLRPSVLRSLYSVGLFCKHFELERLTNVSETKLSSSDSSTTTLDELVEILILYARFGGSLVPTTSNSSKSTSNQHRMRDPDMCHKAVSGLGFLLTRHDELLASTNSDHQSNSTSVKAFFDSFLSPRRGRSRQPSAFYDVQCLIVELFNTYLLGKERQAMEENAAWSTNSKSESLKELADKRQGQSCVVAQLYLGPALNACVVTPLAQLRRSALAFASTVARQGLIHPTQLVNWLIALQADTDQQLIRARATSLLAEIDGKMPGVCLTQAVTGLYLAFQLVFELNSSMPCDIVRGARRRTVPNNSSKSTSATNVPVAAINQSLYTLVQSNRRQRRSLLFNLLSLFDSIEVDTVKHGQSDSSRLDQLIRKHNRRLPSSLPCWSDRKLAFLLFLTDQLAHFDYASTDEVYYLVFHIDQRVSQLGPSMINSVRPKLVASLAASKVATDDHLDRHLDDLLDRAASGRHGHDDEEEDDLERRPLSGVEKRLGELMTNVAGELVGSVNPIGWPACLLLTRLRQHLTTVYGISEAKLSNYSPSDDSRTAKSTTSAGTNGSSTDKTFNQPITRRGSAACQFFPCPALVKAYLSHPDWLVAANDSRSPPLTLMIRQLTVLHGQLMNVGISNPADSPPSLGRCYDDDAQEMICGGGEEVVNTLAKETMVSDRSQQMPRQSAVAATAKTIRQESHRRHGPVTSSEGGAVKKKKRRSRSTSSSSMSSLSSPSPSCSSSDSESHQSNSRRRPSRLKTNDNAKRHKSAVVDSRFEVNSRQSSDKRMKHHRRDSDGEEVRVKKHSIHRDLSPEVDKHNRRQDRHDQSTDPGDARRKRKERRRTERSPTRRSLATPLPDLLTNTIEADGHHHRRRKSSHSSVECSTTVSGGEKATRRRSESKARPYDHQHHRRRVSNKKKPKYKQASDSSDDDSSLPSVSSLSSPINQSSNNNPPPPKLKRFNEKRLR